MADEPIRPAPSGSPIRPGNPGDAPTPRPGSAGTTRDTIPLKRPAPTRPSGAPHPVEIKDNLRETIETVVFVVVLVLMLKTFLAEAFVIPTGSMATTLYGYHKDITCEKCGYEFPVNVSPWAEPSGDRGQGIPILTAKCPNCEFSNPVKGVGRRP
jgi:Signal peptidase, peptidase S26